MIFLHVMAFLILFFAAPIAQIKLSYLRIAGRTTLPIALTAFFMFVLGIVLSLCENVLVVYIDAPVAANQSRCAFPEALLGIFITIISIPPIGIISALIYLFKKRRLR